jgi:SAM-dependent methyltransferase
MLKTRPFCRIDKSGCICCQGREFVGHQVINDELAATWELDTRARQDFDEREGHCCRQCGMSRRVRMLLWSIRRIFPSLAGRSLLHLNQINGLSPALKDATTLVSTIHKPSLEMGAIIDGCINQDMTQLALPDNQFDLVVHSETLEHIHDFERALDEAHRVLKPGGFQIYSIPLLHGRKTRRRMGLDSSGNEVQLLPLSTHGGEGEYPVVWEFGADFLEQRRHRIYQIHYDSFWRNRTVFSIVEKKQG